MLGCLIFNMLTGFPPFYDNDLELLYQKIRAASYKENSPLFEETLSEGAKDCIA
jgi:serine/threonine-protein kinase RCK2